LLYNDTSAGNSNPKNINYEDYGGRGITICERWLGENGFIHFLQDMGRRPKGMSLDRINVNGNYEPGNCRWATAEVQVHNRRCSIKVPEGYVDPELREEEF